MNLRGAASRIFLAFTFLLLHPYFGYCQASYPVAYNGLGPLPIINQAPTLIPFLQPRPDRAATMQKGAFELSLTSSLTNTLVSQASDHYKGIADMETMGSAIDLKVGLSRRLEFSVSLPFYYSYSGFMDRAILDVEETFGKPRTVRKNETHDRYGYRVERDGRVFLGGTKTFSGAGDISLFTKYTILTENALLPHMSARIGAKLPTGSRERSLSSGQVDTGIGFLAQKRFGRLTGFMNADLIFPGEAYKEASVSMRNYYILLIAAEYAMTERLSFTVQAKTTSRPFEATGLSMLDRRIHDLTIGFSYLSDNGIFIQGGGVEDFRDSTEAGADITFFFILGKRFN